MKNVPLDSADRNLLVRLLEAANIEEEANIGLWPGEDEAIRERIDRCEHLILKLVSA